MRTERALRRAMLWWLPFALLGYSATAAFDAGTDAGDSGSDAGDSGVDAGEPAPSCDDQFRAAAEGFRTSQAVCFSGEPDFTRTVTFRVRNVGTGDVWIPRFEYYGAVCSSAVRVTTCAGALVRHSLGCGLTELCPDELLRLAPDASVELSWSPYVEFALGCGCRSTILLAGSYSARLAYTSDGGRFPSSQTAELPFVLSADSGVIDIEIP